MFAYQRHYCILFTNHSYTHKTKQNRPNLKWVLYEQAVSHLLPSIRYCNLEKKCILTSSFQANQMSDVKVSYGLRLIELFRKMDP